MATDLEWVGGEEECGGSSSRRRGLATTGQEEPGRGLTSISHATCWQSYGLLPQTHKPRKACKLVLFLVSVHIYFTQSMLQIAYIWHQPTHLCFRLRASYISCQDTSWALRANCFHANYHSYFTHLAVTFKSMLCANVAPPDHPDLPVSDDFYKI